MNPVVFSIEGACTEMKQVRLMERGHLETVLPALKNCVYLNTGGIGPMPMPVFNRINESYQLILDRGEVTPSVLEELRFRSEKTREKLSSLLGIQPSELSFIRSVAEGINMIVHSLRWKAGDEVITTDQENPAGLLPLYNLAIREAVRVKQVALENNAHAIIERVDNAINARTKLLVLSHVTHNTGLRLPVETLCEKAHQRGVPVLIDGAQAIGQFPVNLKKMTCDFYAIAGYKWLLGPDGTCALYIRGDWLDRLSPCFAGVGSQKAFDLHSGHFEFNDSAKRFEFGARHWPLYIALGESVALITDFGLDRIQDKSRKLASRLYGLLQQLPTVRVISPDREALRSGIVTWASDAVDAKHLTAWLWNENRILVQWRHLSGTWKGKKGVRISVAFFTSEDDIKKLIEAIQAFLNLRGI